MLNIFLAFVTLSICLLRTHAASEPYSPSDVKSISLRTHSLKSPYLDDDMTSRWWDFGGDTLIRADSYVRLASDIPSQSGRIWSKIPLTATNWEIEFEFQISGRGNIHGDGFALWITKDRAQNGPVFGSKDRFEGLGLFFDTYKNNRPGVVFPYVMAMFGDGREPYDAANDGKANEVGGCSARGLRGASVPSKGRLVYFQDKSLQLQLQYKTEGDWIDCFKVEATEERPVKMPATSYLGFSAHTGELSDNFDIISVETRNLYAPSKPGDGTRQAGPRERVRLQNEKKSSGWGWFLFKVVAVISVCGGGYVGYTAYKTKQRREYKGF